MRATALGYTRALKMATPLAFSADTPLGFLAALGTLRLSAVSDPAIELGWGPQSGTLKAYLANTDAEQLVKRVFDALTALEVGPGATTFPDGERTPFDLCGAGRAQVVSTIERILNGISREKVREALLGPWQWQDPGSCLGWYPRPRHHALRAEAPTKVQPRRVAAAVCLAWVGLHLFRAVDPGVVVGWRTRRGKPQEFTWPVWSTPASLDTVRTLLAVPELVVDEPSASKLRGYGIQVAFRCRRIRIGKSSVFTAPSPIAT